MHLRAFERIIYPHTPSTIWEVNFCGKPAQNSHAQNYNYPRPQEAQCAYCTSLYLQHVAAGISVRESRKQYPS